MLRKVKNSIRRRFHESHKPAAPARRIPAAAVAGPSLLDQARALYEGGYFSASVCLSRVSVEKAMRRLATLDEPFPPIELRNTRQIAFYLKRRKLVDKRWCNDFCKFARQAHPVCHGREVSAERTADFLEVAEHMCQRLEDSAKRLTLV